MASKDSIEIIKNFKGESLYEKLKSLKESICKEQIYQDHSDIYTAALEIKRLSAQIDEIVHATGIIQCLPKILKEGEKVEKLSLASGADGDGFDLVTNMRIAEFKFARWQVRKANGMRKRHVFADLVRLYLYDTTLKKEMYVMSAYEIEEFFKSRKAKWKNVLSKSGGLEKKLEQHLNTKKVGGESLWDVYDDSDVKIHDLDKFLDSSIKSQKTDQ